MPRLVTLIALAASIGCTLLLYRARFRTFGLFGDDFEFVEHVVHQSEMGIGIWTPHAAHFCPLFRILTWVLINCAGSLSHASDVLRYGPILSLILVLLSLFVWTRNETGSSLNGLFAACIMGITSVYSSAVEYHAGSLAVWSLGFTLLSLLAWQAWCDRRSTIWALLGIVGTFLAPCWWSAGLLAGPIAGVYVMLRRRTDTSWTRRVFACCLPQVGTVAFLVMARIVWWPNPMPTDFEGRPFWLAFRPHAALGITARAIAETQLFGNVAIPEAHFSLVQAIVVLVPVLIAMSWAGAGCNRVLLGVGLSLMLLGYVFPFSFRSRIDYEYLRDYRWYTVFPQAGLSLLIPAYFHWRRREDADRLYVDELMLYMTVCVGLVVLHYPVTKLRAETRYSPLQRSQLQQLELVQELSERHGISRDALQEAVGPFNIEGGPSDGLLLIRTTATPKTWEVDDLRHRLRRVLERGEIDAFQ